MQIGRIAIATLVFTAGSCAIRSVHAPAAQNIFLFSRDRQIQASAYAGIDTYQLQMGYNPLRHLVLGLNNSYGSGLAIYEGCVGFYDYSKKDANWRYEILAGGGYTSNTSQSVSGIFSFLQNRNSNFEATGIYSKFFLQPSFGFFAKINIYKLSYSFSFGNRFSYLDFKRYIYREIDVDHSPINGPTTYLVNKEYDRGSVFLLEPCITNKIGRNKFFILIQLMGIFPYSNSIDVRSTKFSPSALLSLGIQYTFYLKKKTQP